MKSNLYFALAETDPIFKQVLIESLTRSPFYKLAYSASNGYEFINSFHKKKLDVVLLDVFMPVLSGIEATRLLRNIDRRTPVICYTPTFQADIAAILAPLNTRYCEKKSTVITAMLDNIFNLGGGGIDYQAYSTNWEKETYEKLNYLAANHYVADFNTTELRLMKLTYEGFTNKEIAEMMNLSNRTIDTYINRLTEKLGLRNKTDLIRYTVEHGLYNTSL